MWGSGLGHCTRVPPLSPGGGESCQKSQSSEWGHLGTIYNNPKAVAPLAQSAVNTRNSSAHPIRGQLRKQRRERVRDAQSHGVRDNRCGLALLRSWVAEDGQRAAQKNSWHRSSPCRKKQGYRREARPRRRPCTMQRYPKNSEPLV